MSFKIVPAVKEIKTAIQSVDEKLNWRLLSLEFSNMFSYGLNNFIDFTILTFDEITGLFGPNSIGKTSLIDILLFSLFDDYSRNYQDKNKLLSGTIVNTKEKTFSCKVSFCVDNSIYYIEKEGKRLGAKSDNTFDTFKFTNYDFYKMESNNKIQLNGHDRFETLDKIKNLIGEYSDFCVSSVCLQSNNRGKIDFFNMSPIEKKVFLNDRLKFNIFKKIETKYKDLLKETKINLKNIEKLDEYQNYNHNIDEEINELNLVIANYEQEKNKLYEQQQNNNNQLNILYKQLKSVDDTLNCELLNKQEIIDDIILISEKINNYDNINFDNQIEELYNDNLYLSKNLSSSNDLDLDELLELKTEITNKILITKNKIHELTLIKNKNNIIELNNKFEKQKIEKTIILTNKINSELNLNPKNKFSKKIVDDLNQILTETIIYDISNKKEESRISINNLENNIYELTKTINKIKNIINDYDICVDDICILYNSINYDDYCKTMISTLSEYNKYNELNKIIETNSDVFTLLNNFNNCVNKSCYNCVKHSKSIVQLFSKLKINEECNLIKNKFNELHKYKLEYEKMIVFHNKLKLNNCNKTLELLNLMLENEKNNFEKLTKQINDTTINDFKVFLQNNIHIIEQHNYINELKEVNDLVNDDYLMLMYQIEQANILNEQLNILENQLIDINKHMTAYEKDKELLIRIEFNNNKIKELKNSKNNFKLINDELLNLNYKLKNINNFEYNTQTYISINKLKNNSQLITQIMINQNNEFNNNNNQYKKLVNTKSNYIKFIDEINKYNGLINIYENIIKITGPKGIPRQIINIKLQQIEDTVNGIILPFVNKKINITKEIDDIKIFINDGISKYYSSGGMENFIISLAFKIAFTNTFNIPNIGILFIDEGVSVLDKNHTNNFSVIATFIKKYYNHIILITHIDTFYDYTFDIINITKNKKKQSFVNYTRLIRCYESNNIVKLNKVKQTKTCKIKEPVQIQI